MITRKYLLIMLMSLPLISACVGDMPGAVDELTEDELADANCANSVKVEEVSCHINLTNWRMKSITSDVARPTPAGGSTRDWATFRDPCYADLRIEIHGYLFSEGSYFNSSTVSSPNESCREIFLGGIAADPSYKSLVNSYGTDYSEAIYDVEFADRGDTKTETWYDIEFKQRDYYKYKVNQTVDGVDYRLSVELEFID